MTDITIPQDVAKYHANRLREPAMSMPPSVEDRELADLLDPPAPTLRERVAEALGTVPSGEDWTYEAVAALAVIADAVEALPTSANAYLSRTAVLALLRGESRG